MGMKYYKSGAAVSKDGNNWIVPTLIVGDSMTAGTAENGGIGVGCSRTDGIATLVFSGNHSAGSLENIRVYNCSDASFNTNGVSITKISNTSFSYPSPGPDAPLAVRDIAASKTMQFQRGNSQTDGGYLFWLNSKSKGAFSLALNAGNNGNTAADMRVNMPSFLERAPDAQVVIVLTGYNDFAGAGRTAIEVVADVVAITEMCARKLVVLVSAIPWTSGGTATNRKEALKYCGLLKSYAASRPNTRYADAARLIVDNASATIFAPLAGMLRADNIHPSPKGYEKIATAIWDVLKTDVSVPQRLVSSKYDNYGSDPTNPNIADFAPWTNSGGNVSGGATGTVAAGLYAVNSGAGTTVASCPARADSLSWDQQIVHTPTAGADSGSISSGGYIYRVSEGQKLIFMAEIALSGLSGSNFKGIEIPIQFSNQTAVTGFALKATAETAAGYPQTDGVLTIVSPVITAPAGATGVGWSIDAKAFGAGAAVTVKAGLISLEKQA